MSNGPVLGCWRCGYPFRIYHTHAPTGHVIKICANVECNAPQDLRDDIGLDIMSNETAPEARNYAAQWRRARMKAV